MQQPLVFAETFGALLVLDGLLADGCFPEEPALDDFFIDVFNDVPFAWFPRCGEIGTLAVPAS